MRFQLKNETNWINGTIEGFTDSSFLIHETEVMLNDISVIDIRGKNHSTWSFKSSPGKLIFAGLAFPIVDMLNQRQVVTPGILIISGGLIVAGIVMKAIERKEFSPGDRNRIRIIR